MKLQRVCLLLTITLFSISSLSIKPTIVTASDWTTVIKDTKDCDCSADIKSVAIKDNGSKFSFKLESWKNWDLMDCDGFLAIFINPTGSDDKTDCSSFITIFGSDDLFIPFLFDVEEEEIVPADIDIDFSEDKAIGTFEISKKDLKVRGTKFSICTYIMYGPKAGYYVDAAPDNQKMVLYKSSGTPPPAKLGVSKKTLDLGILKFDDEKSDQFTVFNEGEGTINATIKSSSNIRLDTDEFILEDYEEETIVVSINARNLTPKLYNEPIEIRSNHGTETVQVYFEVLPKPVLSVDREMLDFGTVIKGEKVSETLTISNEAKGLIQVDLSTNNKWIVLSKKTFESDSEKVVVSLSTKTLEEGPIEGTIRITSNGGSTTIEVKADIVNSLSIDKTEFDFGEINFDNQQVEPILCTIRNQTNKSITIQMEASEDWIAIGSKISLTPDETKEVKVMVKLDKMKTINHSYEGNITFESQYDKQVIPVKAYLKQQPPKTTWLTDPPDQKSVEEKLITGKTFEKLFTIKNDGSGVMEVSVKLEDNKTDFRLFNAKFSLKKGETSDIKIKFDSTSLKLGTYKNTLLIESNGGNLSIPIILEIVPKPIVVIKLYIGLQFASINDEQIKLEEAPFINKGTTMVPLRFIADAFKATIEWVNIGKGRILLTFPKKTIQLDIGEPYAFINTEKIPLQAPAQIKNSRTFVPIRFIAEGLGASIEWKADTQQITIFYTLEE